MTNTLEFSNGVVATFYSVDERDKVPALPHVTWYYGFTMGRRALSFQSEKKEWAKGLSLEDFVAALSFDELEESVQRGALPHDFVEALKLHIFSLPAKRELVPVEEEA